MRGSASVRKQLAEVFDEYQTISYGRVPLFIEVLFRLLELMYDYLNAVERSQSYLV
ncbi:MAG: hypothetical protein RIF33_16795 [Cyclobacteriaceae bacterium]